MQFFLNMSANCSDVHLAIESEEVIKRFEEHCETLKGTPRTVAVPKIEAKSQQTTPAKKKQKTGDKKTSFFSNFD